MKSPDEGSKESTEKASSYLWPASVNDFGTILTGIRDCCMCVLEGEPLAKAARLPVISELSI